MRPACVRRICARSTICRNFRSRRRRICATIIPSACSRSRVKKWRGSMRRRARRARPTVVGYTKKDIDTWADVMARSIRASGGRPGMRVHISYGYGLFTGGLGAHYGAERLGCTVIPISGGMTERQVQLIEDFASDIIMVTPSYMLAILDEYRRIGRDPRKSPAQDRHFRRGAVDAGDARRRSRRRSISTPSTSTACRR